MQKVYGVFRKGNNNLISFGSKSEMCYQWGTLKYRIDPEISYVVSEIKIEKIKELSDDDIKKEIDSEYPDIWRCDPGTVH